MDAKEIAAAMAENSRTERKRQSKRALLTVFVLCPGIAIAVILALKAIQVMAG